MITIRPATPDDTPAILALESTSPGAAHWERQEYFRILNNQTAAERVILVAGQDQLENRNSELLGFIVARVVATEWEIENIAVAQKAQGRGLGSQLVQAILQLAGQRGGVAVHLEVRESNAAARGLYEKCGFIRTGRRSGYYWDPPEDALIFRLQLSEGALKIC